MAGGNSACLRIQKGIHNVTYIVYCPLHQLTFQKPTAAYLNLLPAQAQMHSEDLNTPLLNRSWPSEYHSSELHSVAML